MSSADAERSRTRLHARCAFIADELTEDVWIEFDDRIRSINRGPSSSGVDRTLEAGVLAPGLIDLQLNGAFGVDIAAADDAGWEHLLTQLPRTGVTSVLPTLISAPISELATRLERGVRWCDDQLAPTRPSIPRPRTLGFHVEGPFIAESRRGAHDAAVLSDPSPAAIDRLLQAAGRHLALVTLAPERQGAMAAIRQLVANGTRVAIGHSDATEIVVSEAVDAGATLVTHLYNAQRPLHHRDPGVVGAALTDPRLTLGLIADGFHVAPTAIAVAFAAAGERVALVTDAVAALGMPAGRFELGGEPVDLSGDGPPRRQDGSIAGAAAPLDRCIATTVAAGVDPVHALRAATSVPARAIGRPDLGRLEVGAPADLVWLDERWRTRSCWVAGREIAAVPPGSEEA